MSTHLYRLGRASHRHRRVVLALWLALLGLAGVGEATLSHAGTATGFGAAAATLAGTAGDPFTATGSESRRAADLLRRRLPEAGADTASARLVFTLDAGDGAGARLDDSAHRAAIEEVLTALGRAPLVGRVGDPFGDRDPGAEGDPGTAGVMSVDGAVSGDGRTAYTLVTYTVRDAALTAGARSALFAAAGPARAAGIAVEFGGTALDGAPGWDRPGTARPAVPGAVLAAAVLAVVLGVLGVLGVAFGSLVAATLALLTAILGVAVGGSAVRVATSHAGNGSPTPVPVLILGLAVAVGYSLFIVTRYRHELAAGRSGEDAAGNAVGTTGSTVVFSGLMTAGALAALSVARVPALTAIGLAAAGTVLIAALGMLTLLPAVLGLAGRAVAGGVGGRGGGLGERWARFVVRRRVPAVLVCLAAVGAVATPVAGLRLGLPDGGTAAPGSTQRHAYDQLAAAFGAGFNGPLLLVVEPADGADPTAAVARVRAAVAGLGDVALATEPRFGADGHLATMTVIPVGGPGDPDTAELVRGIRARADALAVTTGARVRVTGRTAMDLDVSWRLAGVLPLYLAVLAGLAVVVLAVASRSVLLPLKAAVGTGLSAAATLGAVVAAFQWGWLAGAPGVARTGPTAAVLPMLVIAVLAGLSMCGELHLVARTRAEFVRTGDPDGAVVSGIGHGARAVVAGAVTAAGVVVTAGVLAALAAPADPLARSTGLALAFALALGLTVDTFVLRLTFGVAVMSLLGRTAWWLPRPPGRAPAASPYPPPAVPSAPAPAPAEAEAGAGAGAGSSA